MGPSFAGGYPYLRSYCLTNSMVSHVGTGVFVRHAPGPRGGAGMPQNILEYSYCLLSVVVECATARLSACSLA